MFAEQGQNQHDPGPCQDRAVITDDLTEGLRVVEDTSERRVCDEQKAGEKQQAAAALPPRYRAVAAQTILDAGFGETAATGCGRVAERVPLATPLGFRDADRQLVHRLAFPTRTAQ